MKHITNKSKYDTKKDNMYRTRLRSNIVALCKRVIYDIMTRILFVFNFCVILTMDFISNDMSISIILVKLNL